MPLALIIFGILAMIVGFKGNYPQVASQLESDLTGSGSFALWVLAILALAVIGKMMHMPQATKMFMALIVAVYLVSNAGIFTQFETAFQTLQPASATSTVAASANGTASPASAAASAAGVAAVQAGASTITGSGSGLITSLSAM